MARDWEPIDYEWPALEDIDWLRATLSHNWSADHPQPYIGVGPDDATMSLYWKTVEETVTLEIETVAKTGDLYRAPNQAIGEVELALDMDLTHRGAWQQIASALGVEVGRDGNILAPGVERPVPRRGSIGGRFPSKNKSGTSGFVRGRSRAGKRTGTGRTARYSRGVSFSSRMVSTRGRYRLYRGRVGVGRRYASVRARTA